MLLPEGSSITPDSATFTSLTLTLTSAKFEFNCDLDLLSQQPAGYMSHVAPPLVTS